MIQKTEKKKESTVEQLLLQNDNQYYRLAYSYVKNDADLKKTAAALTQHENTVRYRLEKIRTVCGLSYRFAADGEQLSLAAKIHMARTLLPEVR